MHGHVLICVSVNTDNIKQRIFISIPNRRPLCIKARVSKIKITLLYPYFKLDLNIKKLLRGWVGGGMLIGSKSLTQV